jgi:hypothetical protein
MSAQLPAGFEIGRFMLQHTGHQYVLIACEMVHEHGRPAGQNAFAILV